MSEYDQGFDDGFRDGERKGYDDGYDEGWAAGHREGYQEGENSNIYGVKNTEDLEKQLKQALKRIIELEARNAQLEQLLGNNEWAL